MASATGRNAETASGTRMACRVIGPGDEEALVALLCEGFPERSARYWSSAVASLGVRPTPEGFPRYGYCLTANESIVGVVLLIHSVPLLAESLVRCCVSSWYVRPYYRIYASALAKMALRRNDCTYINMSSAAHTRDGLSAQGYSCYARGQFLALPALGRRAPSVSVRRIGQDAEGSGDEMAKLLRDHAEAGCISLLCTTEEGLIPFVFLKRGIKHVPFAYAQLVYCFSVQKFVELQGPVGRYLLRMGLCCVLLDANGPINGLRGFYLDGRMPKYYKGPEVPRLGDLSYSEAVLFGP